ncbi:MAG: triose-phosphate isomerase [Peptococcaceae bacterium]|jgi:triosephosphate isomerase|nr:triose-phosphate isomerase [Peptococcaceae bacterium]
MVNRRPLIAGNWKMNKTISEARDFAARFLENTADITGLDILICAPFTNLPVLKEELEESIVHIGAQNMHYETKGAYTGEISPLMLKELACTYVIIGHSERREYFKEDDEIIAKKVKAALENGITPILCVGENLSLREAGKAQDFVRGQVEKDLAGLTAAELSRIVVAYEPIWAIGTGKTASAQDAQQMCAAIRSTVADMAGSAAQEMRILYGGSAKSGNIAELMAQPDIDGGLIGGSSLDVQEFTQLIQNAR